MPGVDEIKRDALALDAPRLADTLRRLSADEAERAAARAWVLRDRVFFQQVRENEPPYSDERHRELNGTALWMRIMCLIALCPPVEAARAVRWGDLWDHMAPPAREQAAVLVAEQPRTWAERFLATTAEARLSASDARHSGGVLDWLVERGLAAHDLPCPAEGRAFVEHHLTSDWRDPLNADRVRRDRLTPEIVYLKITFGFAAQLAPLEEAIPALLEDGTLDRSELIERCLESLTVDTRPGSQRVVAKLLARVGLRPAEVRGGLAYLTGVIATRDGAVGAYLLPLALALIEDAEGLGELTRVIAGRTERKQKQVLVGALRSPELKDRVGADGILAAAELLAAGQEDASLLAALQKLDAELGRVRDPEPLPAAAGLWGLTLDPGPQREWPGWVLHGAQRFGRYTWSEYLDRLSDADARTFEFTADRFLRHVAAHGPDRFVERCRRLRLDGRLGLSRLVRLVEPAFLAGGLSVLWPAVLDVAEELAPAGAGSAGMPELLRLLTRYAAEVPDERPLPPGLAGLAGSAGATRSQLEARALAAALARTDPRSLPSTESRPAPAADPQPVRGLWHRRTPVPALARALSGEAPRGLRADEVPYLLAVGNGALDPRSRWTRGSYDLMWLDEHLVTTLALLVQVHGVERIRRFVAEAPRPSRADTGPTTDALGTWLGGDLTPDTYWDVLQRGMPTGPTVDRVVFAWTCEQLVRLPSHPGLLSLPDRTDGTIAPSALAGRVLALAGVAEVGPLDLLLTLTRLTAGEGDAEDLDRLAGVELWTDPAVTRTGNGQGSFDVVPHLRARIADPAAPIDTGWFRPLAAADLAGPASHDDVLRRVWPKDPRFDDAEEVGAFMERRRIRLENGRLPPEHWSRMLDGLLSGSRRNERAVEDLVVLANHDGVLDPGVTVPVALDRLRAGDLPLSGLVDSLQFAFERGGLPALWPLALAVAAAATEKRPKPHGLDRLLGCLARYAPEVPLPGRVVPAELTAFAAESGRSKSHAAARDLVAVLRAEEGPTA